MKLICLGAACIVLGVAFFIDKRVTGFSITAGGLFLLALAQAPWPL